MMSNVSFPRRRESSRSAQAAFTLIEVLVVVAILMPIFQLNQLIGK
jgi:competence protein ComGC